MSEPSRPALPAGAYAALEGLKAQAKAAMQMFPTCDKATRTAGKKALGAAQATMKANEEWVTMIIKLMRFEDKCLDDVDVQWLEKVLR
ncbi:hypothetical protein IFT48_03805 [Pseudomonas fluorescens]|uniref:hypothetical protein n=1 Tax=Pseudomonas TaxID=286 RepID=UPI000F02DA30|nr:MULTISPECIES: hypothetical protein [Pseudomonas]MBD8089095.1 hypothetical protein [Pseudomonas fluorescens]MBD8681868.1 hypothetical protein [Pseudomonas sp. CFBP 13719]